MSKTHNRLEQLSLELRELRKFLADRYFEELKSYVVTAQRAPAVSAPRGSIRKRRIRQS